MCRPGAVRLLPHGQSGRGHHRSSIHSTQHLISRGQGRPVKPRGQYRGQGGLRHRSINRTPHFMGRGPVRSVKQIGRIMGWAKRPISNPHLMGHDLARPVNVSKLSTRFSRGTKYSEPSARPGPAHQNIKALGPARPGLAHHTFNIF